MSGTCAKWLRFGTGVLLFNVLLCAGARPIGQRECAGSPCANTSTGEDPSVLALRAEDARERKLQEGPDDKLRWRAIPLYSDSTDTRKLRLVLVAAAGSTMELLPATGVLRFTAPGRSASFHIASPRGGRDDICPGYNLKVIEADPDYAIVRRACRLYEYVANRFHMSVEYFLFDWRTSTMRSLWLAARSSKDAPFPDARPGIAVTKLPNGYRFDWAGMFPSDGSPTAMKISNSYIRQHGSDGLALVCTDLTAPKGEGLENEMCEGGVLLRADKPRH